jgi:hypothetical protein
MTRPTTTTVAVSLWALAVTLVAATLVLIAWSGGVHLPAGLDTTGTGNTLRYLIPATIGAVLAVRRPRNRIGWVLLVMGLSYAAYPFVTWYTAAALFVAADPLPAWRAVAWAGNWVWVPSLACLGLTLLLFPTGRPPSPRWRPVAWLAVAAPAAVMLLGAGQPGTLQVAAFVTDPLVTARLTNPLGVAFLPPRLVEPVLLVILGTQVLAAGSLLVRFRRSRGVERQQIKWVAYAALLLGLHQGGLALAYLAGLTGPDWAAPLWVRLVENLTFGFLFVAIAVAVLRYRLYEIDRLINRTLVYGLLTAVLGSTYAGVVLVLGQLLGQDSSLAVAGATLAVAALFQPARRRIQQVVDRRFNRRRYDAARTVEAFSARLREEIDLEALSAELLAVVNHAMQPTAVSLWLRPPTHGPSGPARGAGEPPVAAERA